MLGVLSEENIDQLLESGSTGRIGCYDGEKVYIVPVSYAYNGTYLVAHSAEGMKIKMMRKNPEICFQVDHIESGRNWQSVVLWGKYEEVTDPKERYYAMKFLVGRLMHIQASETAGVQGMSRELANPDEQPHELKPVVYRIRIKERTGRFEKDGHAH
ncbi:pyridoxamine 5'-phosphate oxidase family protein [Chitinophaga sp. XS-30]|uniref:pyridoxamine 5'-phosphate oxidase family protein n=1 Tax=Chitinophaga sp. XS-30 TaxID=2604421 RepID=UPI0011DCE236|nr:pyridoxamine 5'-phosphate oxidase family protein [Chitinophaga sp. XS-30]QEH42672.1 pyridoxamine 5'-phosphate oxidase family protein [Chitinophaga sp. XS-30]